MMLVENYACMYILQIGNFMFENSFFYFAFEKYPYKWSVDELKLIKQLT